MSSHHIVRDRQEPALLILNAVDFSYELLGQLLEWSPTVIATAETVNKLVADGIKVDWLVTNNALPAIQSNIRLISYNNSVLKAVLDLLINENYNTLNVVTNKFEADDIISFTNRIDIVIYEAGRKIYPVKSGFSKWKPAGETINIFNAPDNVNYEGLQQLGYNNFTTIADGFFTLIFDQDVLFISEDI